MASLNQRFLVPFPCECKNLSNKNAGKEAKENHPADNQRTLQHRFVGTANLAVQYVVL